MKASSSPPASPHPFTPEFYLKGYAHTKYFLFQECVRTLAAKYSDNSAAFKSGRTELALIKALLSVPEVRLTLGTNEDRHKFLLDPANDKSFLDMVGDAVNDADCALLANPSANVRSQVKRVLRQFGRKDMFLPWEPYPVDESVLLSIRETAANIQFRFRLVDGKVYAVGVNPEDPLDETLEEYTPAQGHARTPTHMCTTDLRMVAYRALPNLRAAGLVPNPEEPHITIVNSDIVPKVPGGAPAVDAWLAAMAPAPFHITTGSIRQTFSEDYSPFAGLAAIGIASEAIDGFKLAWNTAFPDAKINPSAHITIAVKLRALA